MLIMPIDRNPPLAPWRVERTHHILKDRWISVRADTCLTEEGTAIDPFYVLEYPDWVQIVAIDENDQLVLVEQYRHGLGISSLELPTGGVDPRDSDPVSAAQRELEEETGLRSDNWRLVASLAPNPANQSNRCHVVLALNVKSGGISEDDPTERLRVSLVPVDEAAELARNGGIIQAMHIAALALALTDIGRWHPDSRLPASR
jgi:8-oxo-dGDP phosphatase